MEGFLPLCEIISLNLNLNLNENKIKEIQKDIY
jgi:hypothetical protein